MAEKISGKRGELLRIGLAARNWALTHIDDDESIMAWKCQDSKRSSAEIATHISFTLVAVCHHIAGELGLTIDINEPLADESGSQLKAEIRGAYDAFKELCTHMSDEMLEYPTTLPPPARIQESSVETILRIIAGYHTIHHSGQIAMQVKMAKRAIKS
ncbi:MAG: DinB family protein [Candidatus Thorarchaeota archaeon]